MDISQRVSKIQPYFVSFNIIAEESAAYAVVRFPQSWKIPNKAALKENFKVEIAPIQEGVCFVTEIVNGSDCVFDAIDYVVDFNKKVEERKGLFEEKIKELGDIFAKETLDRLKTLKFTFEPQKKGAKKSAPKKQETTVEPEVCEIEVTEAGDVEVVQDEKKVEEKKPQVEENSLMGFAKSITGE